MADPSEKPHGAPDPFKEAALADDEKATLLRHINAKWTAKTCPFCNQSKWDIGGWSPILLGPGAGNVVIGGAVLPSVAMVCMTCGNTVLINAIIAGIGRRAG
jgi:hypothetical protein